MKILFIGCVESSATLFETLLIHRKIICGVVTKKTSSFNADFVDLSDLCIQHRIPYIYFTQNNKEDVDSFIQDCSPDLIYCFGWSHLLSEDTLAIPKIAAIGFHPAAIPRNKGRHPIIWALVLGLEETASTFFYIEKGVDDGDILSQENIAISKEDTARTLYDKIITIAKKQVVKFTENFERGYVVRKKQDESVSNTWRKRSYSDGCIDFRMGSQTIYNLVRALTKPYDGAHFLYKEKEYKVWSTKVISHSFQAYANIEFGKIIEVYSPTSFLIKTGCGLLKILDSDEINIQAGDYL
jgi:methionyl-tRNA formyltransferase